MTTIVIVLSITLAIFIVGGVWGRIETHQNRKRASSISIPDTPLSNLRVSSGVSQWIPGSQLAYDPTHFRFYFNHFVTMHYNHETGAHPDESELKLIDESRELIISGGGLYEALADVDELSSEVGAIVQNATVYSIVTSIVSSAKSSDMKQAVSSASRLKGARNTKTPEQYRLDMLQEHPRASAIAESSAHIESKKVASQIVGMMGYLIDKGSAGGDQETRQQRVDRMFDEQSLDLGL